MQSMWPLQIQKSDAIFVCTIQSNDNRINHLYISVFKSYILPFYKIESFFFKDSRAGFEFHFFNHQMCYTLLMLDVNLTSELDKHGSK